MLLVEHPNQGYFVEAGLHLVRSAAALEPFGGPPWAGGGLHGQPAHYRRRPDRPTALHRGENPPGARPIAALVSVGESTDRLTTSRGIIRSYPG